MSPCPELLSPSLKRVPGSSSVDRRHHSVLQFTEIKMCSFYCQAQQRLKEIHMYESLNNSHKNSRRNHPNRISTKTSSNQSIDLCVLRDQTKNYFASLGIFMRQERRTLEVKESLLPPSLSFLPT